MSRVRKTLTVAHGLPSNRVHALWRDHSGNLWVGTDAGPAKLQNGIVTQQAVLRRTLRMPITSIGEDYDGRLYFGTKSNGLAPTWTERSRGLFRRRIARPPGPRPSMPIRTETDVDCHRGERAEAGAKWSSHGLRDWDGLFDNSIFGIVEDLPDRFWLACAKGIFVVSRAQLLKFADGELRRVVSRPIDLMQSIECQSGAQPTALRARNGTLWFSTSGGVIAFDPKRLAHRGAPPQALD